MEYRKEVDGLRAVAVLPVIAFHAGLSTFSGGYVGVDVFFVISGYLITSLILEEKAADRFSLMSFYERRARRILPALFTVVAVCIPFAWLWMFPYQLVDFARSIASVSLFGSNFLFWREIGYFGPVAEQKPLLHTWSLAVEEQFYVIFPLCVVALWRFGRKAIFGALAVAAVASLLLLEWTWRRY